MILGKSVAFRTRDSFKGADAPGVFEMNRICVSRGVMRTAMLGLLALLVWGGGCATQQEVSQLQRQIWAARSELDKNKAQIAKLETALQDKLQELEDDRQPLRRSQAEAGAQLDRIELELGRLNGQLEEAGAMSARQGERLSELQERQMTSTMEMQKTVDDLQRRLSLMANYLGLQELAVSSASQTPAGKKASESKEDVAAVQTGKVGTGSGAEELYGKGFELFRNGQFQAARDEFSKYLKLYPKTDLADNAQFWLGECYYAEKKYREAIAAYDKTIKEYPKSDKVKSALLKQGMAFLELGDKTAGRILLKKVVKGYPGSNQAKIAQSKLARIK